MPITLSAAIQVLILSTGIYVVLGFLRTTRGSSLVRGLAVAFVIGVVGLWGVSKYLELEELDYIIQSITGFVVVILAILFQPELRRGIVHLGENPLLGRFLQDRRQEVLAEIAQAAANMANKRQGALIAFERKIPLDAYIEGAVRIDAEVNRFLLDSIFHHGSALHDGAVVVRGDRIEAATALFPLTDNVTISKSTGTRHRAALGLTEETDAVTVVVSEETGSITVCKGGQMERNVPASKLEALLRERIGVDEDETVQATEGLLQRVRRASTRNFARKVGAVAIGLGLFWVAHQDIRETRTFDVTVSRVDTSQATSPVAGQLQIVLSDPDMHLEQPAERTTLEIVVSGTRAELEPFGAGIGGVLLVDPEIERGPLRFPLDEVRWGASGFGDTLEVRWADPPGPLLSVERYVQHRVSFGPESVEIRPDRLNSRYEADLEGVVIEPQTVVLSGPMQRIQELESGELPLTLERVVLREEDTNDRVENLRLSLELREMGLSMVGRETVEVVIPISPTDLELGTIEKEIAVVWLETERAPELDRWNPPTQTALFSIHTAGLLAATEPNGDAWFEQTQLVRQYLEENLFAFVDVAEVSQGGGSGSARVRWILKSHWKDVLPESMGVHDERAYLRLELESEPHLLLIAR